MDINLSIRVFDGVNVQWTRPSKPSLDRRAFGVGIHILRVPYGCGVGKSQRYNRKEDDALDRRVGCNDTIHLFWTLRVSLCRCGDKSYRWDNESQCWSGADMRWRIGEKKGTPR